jgi:molybdopterin/thiamine biosynthesis adenylyltransferase
VLELAYLGIGRIIILDADLLEISNRNREVGAWESHPDGMPKVEVLRELVAMIDSTIDVVAVPERFQSPEGRKALEGVDIVMGCVDRDGARLELNEWCCERGLPLIDMASDTFVDGDEVVFGGRVCVATPETGCLSCQRVLDQREIRLDLASEEQRADEEAIYGVPRDALARGGPSVVSVNGVVASLGVTELMALITGIRAPFPQLDYRGHQEIIRKVIDREPHCYYCGLWPARAS